MMNRWAFLIFLVVVILVLVAFILLTTISDDQFVDTKVPNVYNVMFGLLIAAFAIPIVAFLMYLFYNGMFSFALSR